MTQRHRRRNVHPSVMSYIVDKVLDVETPTATAVYDGLTTDSAFWARLHPNTPRPSLRTVQDIVREFRPPDPSSKWSVAEAEGDEARLVLPVMVQIALRSKQRRLHVTNGEADWIIRVRRAVPELDPWRVYQLARMYMVMQARKQPTDTLDLLLGLYLTPPGTVSKVMAELPDGYSWLGNWFKGLGEKEAGDDEAQGER